MTKMHKNLQKCAPFEQKLTKNAQFLTENFKIFWVVDLRFVFWPFSLLT